MIQILFQKLIGNSNLFLLEMTNLVGIAYLS